MSVLQVLISGVTLFLLFHFLLKTIGSEKVGIWSIVLASASVARISESGFSGSAVKFTAKYLSKGEKEVASNVIQTTMITVGGVTAIIFLCFYSTIVWGLTKIIAEDGLSLAILILPYALASTWIAALAGVLLSGLDGSQNISIRASISIITSLVFLLLVWSLVPIYGMLGLAWAQIIQGLLTYVGAWFFLRRELPSLPRINFRWKYILFRQMLGYGANFQIISICSMLLDPVTKALMAKFGGLTSVAYYEMANRLVTQFRLLLVSANQVLVPRIAEIYEHTPEKANEIYLNSYNLMFFLSIPLFSTIIVSAPLISEIWIGQNVSQFVLFVIILTIAFWVNTISVPSYFYFLGTGLMRWNTISHIIIVLLNILIGYFLGYYFGAFGVVFGYALAIIFGSMFVIFGYFTENKNKIIPIIPIESVKILIYSIFGILICEVGLILIIPHTGIYIGSWILLGVMAIILIPNLWIHPLRSLISSRLRFF